jgi:hypothetical protein
MRRISSYPFRASVSMEIGAIAAEGEDRNMDVEAIKKYLVV